MNAVPGSMTQSPVGLGVPNSAVSAGRPGSGQANAAVQASSPQGSAATHAPRDLAPAAEKS